MISNNINVDDDDDVKEPNRNIVAASYKLTERVQLKGH